MGDISLWKPLTYGSWHYQANLISKTNQIQEAQEMNKNLQFEELVHLANQVGCQKATMGTTKHSKFWWTGQPLVNDMIYGCQYIINILWTRYIWD